MLERANYRGVIFVLGVIGLVAHIAASTGVSTTMQYVFGWTTVATAGGIVLTLGSWGVSTWRSGHAWKIDYVDADLIDSVDAPALIPVGREEEVRIRIRVNVRRPISFEEIAVHPRQYFRRHCIRRHVYDLPPERLEDTVRIVELSDPEAALYRQTTSGKPWVRKFTPVPSRDYRGIWRGFFSPPYVRARKEPLFIAVRLLASEPWSGYLFVRLMTDAERVFHPLEIEAK